MKTPMALASVTVTRVLKRDMSRAEQLATAVFKKESVRFPVVRCHES